MRKILGAVVAVVLVGLAGAAQAEWQQATSKHFVVYADGKPDDVRKLATELEQFDSTIRKFHATPDLPEASSNKLTVYVLPGIADIQKMCGNCRNVAGFYQGRASGSIAFTPRRSGMGADTDLAPRTVLFHEYAHHFLLGNYAFAYPAWFSEGYAELMGTGQPRKEHFVVGAAANHRAYGIFVTQLSIQDLLTQRADMRRDPQRGDALYAHGWLLTHMLMFDPAYNGQLDRYLTLVNQGKPSLDAAKEAFGDLRALDRAMDRYAKARSLRAIFMPIASLPEAKIELRALSPGERALIGLRMVSHRGVDAKTGAANYVRAAPLAAAHPGDAVAQGWFAELALDAGQFAVAEAAADAALKIDPDQRQALLHKAMVLLAAAEKADAPEAVWKAARAPIIRANRHDPNAAQPLVLYYRSFQMEGRALPKSAIAGLYRAQELAPQDDGLRMTAVAQHIADENIPAARRLLRPLAYDPHGSADSPAVKLLAALDGAKDAAGVKAALAAAGSTDPKPSSPARGGGSPKD